MTPRDALIDRFLARSGWEGAARAKLAGDASFRRYERVGSAEATAMLMDAPPEHNDLAPFLAIGDYLVGLSYSAPRILARDLEHGLLLLEDLGDSLFSRVLQNHPHKERELYLAATDWLIDVQRRSRTVLPAIPVFHESLLFRVSLFADWFLPQALGRVQAESLRAEFMTMWEELLARAHLVKDVFVHRDFHADNLLWLPERAGLGRIGLLDFQDAMLGPAAYDLVSLLEDARRDVQKETVRICLEHYLKETGEDVAAFARQYATLGALRNSAIVGIFTRLAVRDGKSGYLKMLPRVWRHLEHDVAHPALAPYAAWLEKHVSSAWRGEIHV